MTSLAPLNIVPAGAGSGKTYTIQQRLCEWIADGRVAPERIAAVTYTESAAAELRERISAKLLAMGRVEDALRLAQTYISTIHGFGLRVLTEFAFQAGTSPRPRLLNDDEQNALIRRALARTDKTDSIVANLAAYGYSYDVVNNKSAEEVFRDDLLRIVQLLRSIGLKTPTDVQAHAAAAAARVATVYGRTKDGHLLRHELEQCINDLLGEYPESLAREYGVNKTAKEALQRDFRNLGFAARTEALETDWKLWQSLRELRRSTKFAPLPERYQELSFRVMAVADGLVRHAGPMRQACEHIAALLAAGQEVLGYYEEAKRQAGLVDYSDMIAMAERLLRERPDVLETLAGRIDCLVVDEFQDTNPLQFALLWRLKEAGIPTLVVGDLKQAIMAFQGADPKLFDALERNNRNASQPLTRNWRSQPGLMRFVNAVGPVLFGESYLELEAKGRESSLAPLDIVTFGKSAPKHRHAVRALAVGQRLKALLEHPSQRVLDRATDSVRRLRGSDIAVLCPTNSTLATYAGVLRTLGLRVNYQSDGWLSSRPVQIAWHALAYLANSADRHAALYLAVTELGSLTLEQGLQQLLDGSRVEDPLLRKLDELAEGVADRTVYALVADTLATLNLFDAVLLWPDGEQARANLVRLMGEAGEFMDSNREALAHGGYHGSGVQTFLAWLKTREHEDDQQPEKRVLDEDAIVLRTWHRSKGLEWPVVAVCGLERAINARLPHLKLGYRTFDDLSRVLENVRIDFSPSFAAPEHNVSQKLDLQKDAVTEARRLLYVALTRARDKLVLEWPQFLVGKKKRAAEELLRRFRLPESKRTVLRKNPPPVTYWSILEGRCVLHRDEGEIEVDGTRFTCEIFKGGTELPEGFDAGTAPAESELPTAGRRAIRPASGPSGLTPDGLAPSASYGPVEDFAPGPLQTARYGEGLDVRTGLAGTELGTFLHRCFEALGERPDLSQRLPEVAGVGLEPEAMAAVASAVVRFEAWLGSFFQAESVLREWPLLMLDAHGSVVSGTADLIVQTKNGIWVLDHKSDKVENPPRAFLGYQAQLEAYARALEAEGNTVLGIGINWIRRGEVTWKRAESNAQ